MNSVTWETIMFDITDARMATYLTSNILGGGLCGAFWIGITVKTTSEMNFATQETLQSIYWKLLNWRVKWFITIALKNGDCFPLIWCGSDRLRNFQITLQSHINLFLETFTKTDYIHGLAE